MSKKRSSLLLTLAAAVPISLMLSGNALAVLDCSVEDHCDLKQLGKQVFYDKISETTATMGCVNCHDPAAGGTPGRSVGSGINQHQVTVNGATHGTNGNLATPTNIYSSRIPALFSCGTGAPQAGGWCGGVFWDSRAEGNETPFLPGATEHIGDEVFKSVVAGDDDDFILEYAVYFGPTADQAFNPFLNPVEQGTDKEFVCNHVAESKYAPLYEKAWGEEIDCSAAELDISYKRIILAICAWQDSRDLNSFSSKRDNALRAEFACTDNEFADYYDEAVCLHEDYINSPGTFPLVGLTDQENLGHDLFYNTRPIPFAPRGDQGGPPFNMPPFPDLPEAGCTFCHSDSDTSDGADLEELYARHDYHSISTPLNPELQEAIDSLDPSLGVAQSGGIAPRFGGDPGFFKTPTVRNVYKLLPTEPGDEEFIRNYTHNGWFKSVESLVHFYNTSFLGNCDRDTDDNGCTDGGEFAYQDTTAYQFGITRCEGAVTEKYALEHNCWPEPEFPPPGTGARQLVGNLGLDLEEEAALVAYMKALTDLETPEAPKPYKAPRNGPAGRR